MKKIQIFSFALFVVAVAACSSQEINDTPVVEEEQNSTALSWEVSPDDLRKEIESTIHFSEGMSKDELSKTELTISLQENGNYLFTVNQPEGVEAFSETGL